MRLSIFLLALLLAGCNPTTGKSGNVIDSLPTGATNIRFQGNGWYSFEWEGNCFIIQTNSGSLMQNYDRAFTTYECQAPESWD